MGSVKEEVGSENIRHRDSKSQRGNSGDSAFDTG